MNVLVVDDDFAIREALDRSLRANGHDVELASDGSQATKWDPHASAAWMRSHGRATQSYDRAATPGKELR
jgi:DNA-binding NtrC family response regulator